MIARVPKCFAQFNFNAEITAEDIDKYVRNGVSTKGDISVIMWQKIRFRTDKIRTIHRC